MKHVKSFNELIVEKIDWDFIQEEDFPVGNFVKIPIDSKRDELVGIRVRISKDSQYYYSNTKSNPTDIMGTIIGNNKYDGFDSFDISVEWDNDTGNVYNYHDLEMTF